MIKPDEKVMKAMQLIARHYPEYVEFLRAWKMSELEGLPDVVINPPYAQGRCRVLKELTKSFDEALGRTL